MQRMFPAPEVSRMPGPAIDHEDTPTLALTTVSPVGPGTGAQPGLRIGAGAPCSTGSHGSSQTRTSDGSTLMRTAGSWARGLIVESGPDADAWQYVLSAVQSLAERPGSDFNLFTGVTVEGDAQSAVIVSQHRNVSSTGLDARKAHR